MQVIPAIDVLEGEVVRLEEGAYDRATTYATDPTAQLDVWSSQGAELVHVVDLSGARSGERDRSLARVMAEGGVPFQLGGGIRSVADATETIDAGASRVVIGTTALWEPSILDGMLAAVGAERLVVSLDVTRGRARGAGWLDEGVPVGEAAARLAAQGVERALVTGIDRDGMMTGPDLGLLDEVGRAAPRLALIGSGGVGSLGDLTALRDTGVEAAIVGRALYEGRFTLAEAIIAAS